MRAASASSKAPEPINIRSIVAASVFQDRIVDFNDEFAQADPAVAATIKLNIKMLVLIDTIRSASALLAVWYCRGRVAGSRLELYNFVRIGVSKYLLSCR
jgi:hypothetical protein